MSKLIMRDLHAIKLRKKGREKKKGRKTLATKFNNYLSCMSNDRTIYIIEKRQRINKANNDRSKLLHLKNGKIKIEIMKLDLTSMNAMQQ